MSKVYFVGCGPGDPESNHNERQKNWFKKQMLLVYSGSLIPPEIIKIQCKKGKKYDASKLVREEIFDLLKKKCQREVKMSCHDLHDGDPCNLWCNYENR